MKAMFGVTYPYTSLEREKSRIEGQKGEPLSRIRLAFGSTHYCLQAPETLIKNNKTHGILTSAHILISTGPTLGFKQAPMK